MRYRQYFQVWKVYLVYCLMFMAMSCSSLSNVKKEKLDTQSGGLVQHSTLFLPLSEEKTTPKGLVSAVSKKPAVLLLHPGFSGDDKGTAFLAEALAQRGFVVAVPSYRGERRSLDGRKSEGKIEFCSGEVDDAQSALASLRARADVDADRIFAFGSSHGGCIALRLAIREPSLRGVVTFSAPVAAEPLLRYLQTHPYEAFFFNAFLGPAIQGYIQGSIEAFPDRYAARSPLFLAYRLSMPVMIFHGSSDHVVPPEHACWLSQVLLQSGRTVKERWLGTDGMEKLDAKPLCSSLDGQAVTSILDAPSTELWMLENQDHVYFSNAAKQAAYQKTFEFFSRELSKP